MDLARGRRGRGLLCIAVCGGARFGVLTSATAHAARSAAGGSGANRVERGTTRVVELSKLRRRSAPAARKRRSARERIAGDGERLSGERSREGARREIELLGVIEQEVLERLARGGAGLREPERDPDDVAVVVRARVGEHPLVGAVDLGELALAGARARDSSAPRPTARSPRR